MNFESFIVRVIDLILLRTAERARLTEYHH